MREKILNVLSANYNINLFSGTDREVLATKILEAIGRESTQNNIKRPENISSINAVTNPVSTNNPPPKLSTNITKKNLPNKKPIPIKKNVNTRKDNPIVRQNKIKNRPKSNNK